MKKKKLQELKDHINTFIEKEVIEDGDSLIFVISNEMEVIKAVKGDYKNLLCSMVTTMRNHKELLKVFKDAVFICEEEEKGNIELPEMTTKLPN